MCFSTPPRTHHCKFVALILYWVSGVSVCWAVELDVPVDFSDDLTGQPSAEGWAVYNGGAQSDQGPDGIGDHALLYSTPDKFHFHTALNEIVLGDYTAAGVTAIQFDARHTGVTDDVVLRVYVFGGNFGAGAPHAISSSPLTIHATDTTWATYTMPLLAEDLDPIQGDVSTLLSDVTQIGLRHDPAGTGARQPATLPNGAQIFFDNVSLVGPEAPVPADFDGDGDVDGVDLMFWRLSYGKTPFGDADGDGDSDGQDFLLWQRQHTGPNGVLFSIPEPGNSSALFIGVATAVVFMSLFRGRLPLLTNL